MLLMEGEQTPGTLFPPPPPLQAAGSVINQRLLPRGVPLREAGVGCPLTANPR